MPIFLARRASCCCALCCSLAICGVVARQRLQIQSLRYGTISVASLLRADAASLRSRPCFCPRRAAICSLVPLGGSVLQASTKRKEAALEESRGPIEIWFASVYRPASSASIELIELNRAAAWLSERHRTLTPSPRRLVVGPASNAAVRPHKLSSLLPESMLSRADVSYSRSNHTHNSADHA